MALQPTMPIATFEVPQTHLQQTKQGLKLHQSNCSVLSSHVFHKSVWCHMLNVDCSCSWTAQPAMTPQHLAMHVVQLSKELVACKVLLDCQNLVFLTSRAECNDLDMLDNHCVLNTQLL
jgi:hypothetical protein